MNISIKNVPEELVRALKERAKANHRSLQGEMIATLEGSLPRTRPRKSIREIAERIRNLGLPRVDEAAAMIREDRDSR
jgi:plasmid stability protein